MDVRDVVQQRLDALETAKEDKRRQEVREAASAYLQRWGKDGTLPKGVPGDSGECVFAHALGGHWNGTEWELAAGITALGLPEDVTEFIRRFDHGEYPDLILEVD